MLNSLGYCEADQEQYQEHLYKIMWSEFCCWLEELTVTGIILCYEHHHQLLDYYGLLSLVAQAAADSYNFFSLSGMVFLTLLDSLFSPALVLMSLCNPLKKPIWNLHWLTRHNPHWTPSTWICLIVREGKPIKKKRSRQSSARHLDSKYNIIQHLT